MTPLGTSSRRRSASYHRDEDGTKRICLGIRGTSRSGYFAFNTRETVVTAATVSLCTLLALHIGTSLIELQDDTLLPLELGLASMRAPNPSENRPLIFFNRPPHTGSDSVHEALETAVKNTGRSSASCFERVHWNELVMKTSLNRDNVDFYGCSARMPMDRFREVARMRDGNVTFVTTTRDPREIILSSYLHKNRARNLLDISDDTMIRREVDSFEDYVNSYPVDSLYNFHGAHPPMDKCPTRHLHLTAMRLAVSRYEVVIDLQRPEESAEMMEIVTGIRPDFSRARAEDTKLDMTNPMLAALSKVDTSLASCGDELVHIILKQQFNVIKDRLMQNRCFDEETGTFALCELAVLKKSEVVERTRMESFGERKELTKLAEKKR